MKRLILVAGFCVLCFVFSAHSEGVKVFVLSHPVSNQRVLVNEPVLVPTTSEILIIATPGEYEPGSFVITGKESLSKVEIETGDLRSKKGKDILPSTALDIKIVKCWYQDKGRGYKEKTPAAEAGRYNPILYSGEKVLVPELLLNDDSLVNVDYKEGKNFIKVKTEKEEKYVDISHGRNIEEIEKELPDGYNKWTGMTLVNDSEKLLPFQLKENENKQVWLTIKIPDNQKPEIYEGVIRIKNEGKEIASIPIKVRVLPFKLGKSHPISSIYYFSPYENTYGEKVWLQFRREMEDLFSHGVDNPTCYQGFNKELLGKDLQIRKETGINSQPFYYLGLPWGFPPIDKVKEVLEFVKVYGIKEVYFYGLDEVTGEKLASQRDAWQAIHQAGGKIFVAGYTAKVAPPGSFALVGDIQDLFVCAGYPSREEAENWHSKEHKIVCYGNPQGGIEATDTYRRNYGILLWQYNYDGAMTYIYHYGFCGFGAMWSDYCGKQYKAHNMVYPTGNGVIDTLQWEGYREGIDDVRYLNVLIEEVKKAKDSQMVKKEAQKFLEELKKGDINRDIEDMDSLRLKIINYIMKLKGKK